jgi:hypothetical protein
MRKIREILVQRRIEAGAKVAVIANEGSKTYGLCPLRTLTQIQQDLQIQGR